MARRRDSAMTWARGWGPLLGLPAAVLLLAPADLPRWAVMWLLSAAVFGGCKWLTWRRTAAPAAPAWRHAAYLLAWPGLDAAAFLTQPSRDRPGPGEWAFAVAKLALGVGLVAAALRVPDDLARGWVGMVGLVFVLHFGLFHLLSCGWRAAGVDARPLMRHPWAATSVTEFWGRRWNTAFRDLTHRFLFRPLAPRVGPAGALAAGFLASGLVHDLVVTVPAGAGHGLPTLYFLLQVPAVALERSRAGRAAGMGGGVRGWLFTASVLLGPLPLLFVPAFARGVIAPFLTALGDLGPGSLP